MKKRGLGKGLDAIFAENTTDSGEGAVTLRVSEIEPNRNQPRKEFNEEALSELAESISEHGLLQPLLVRPIPGGGYQIVAGERRWRASRMAGLSEIPVVIRDMSDSEMAQIALVENLQREDLSPLEEALGYSSLIETYGFTQDEVAKSVGKSRPAVTNALRLLNLPEEIKNMIESGKLSAGHARALLSIEDEEKKLRIARAAAENGLSVREVERLSKLSDKKISVKKAEKKDTFFSETELALKEQLGRRVTVNGNSKKGTLQIEFYGEDDLRLLLEAFK